MNRLSNILLVILMVFLFSCKKIVEPETGGLVISDVEVLVSEQSGIYSYAKAEFFATYTYPGETLGSPKVYISTNGYINTSSSYLMTDDGETLTCEVTGLLKNIVYYFCIGYYDGINTLYTPMWSFNTNLSE